MENLFGYDLIKLLGQGKTGKCWLIKIDNKEYVLKVMNNDTQDKEKTLEIFNGENYAYQRMSKVSQCVPKLLEFNSKEHYLIKEYISGDVAADLAAVGYNKTNGLTDDHFEKIFELNYLFKKIGIHVDYFPTNFIYTKQNQLYCIDYECYDYTSEWDFINWGIYYWLNAKGMQEHLQNGSTDKLNKPGTCKPFSEEFESTKQNLLKKFNKYI